MHKPKPKIIFALLFVVLIFAFLFLIFPRKGGENNKSSLDAFAQCLTEKGAIMYGAYWCPHCQNEKEAFGGSFRHINYVECTEEPQKCLDAGVRGYPTWTFPDPSASSGQRRLEGDQGIENLARESGCLTELEETPASQSQSELLLPWGDLGRRLVQAGVIDYQRFAGLYPEGSDSRRQAERLLNQKDYGISAINQANSGVWLNLLWALGLGNKNQILEEGPMADSQFGNPGVFASTGGWILAQGMAMDHYSQHSLINLTPSQQVLVEETSQNVFRPCCLNPAYFPDCNHGMAMLAFLEIMAAGGADKDKMYQAADQLNAWWFGPAPNLCVV